MNILYRTLLVLAAVSALAGCYSEAQYTSGVDYLTDPSPITSQIPAVDANGHALPSLDERVAAVAAVEPNLRLPGRFGLARLVNGRLTAIPEAEAAIWMELASRHQDFGTFTPVIPLIADLAEASVGTAKWRGRRAHAMETVRLGAARQHLDTVLIYEAGATSTKANTALALADLTILGGAFMPTRQIDAVGKAAAILVDVRNGYPYGFATATADVSTYFTSWGSDRKRAEMREEAVRRVVTELVPEVESMLTRLRSEVEARR